MATLYTEVGQSQVDAAINVADRVNLNEKVFGALHRARARITLNGALAAADIIKIVELPEGAVVIPHLSSAKTGGVTAAVDLDIGHPSDADAFSNGLNLGTAAEASFFNAGATALGAEALSPAPFTAPTWVQAVVNSNAATVADEWIEFDVVFALRQ